MGLFDTFRKDFPAKRGGPVQEATRDIGRTAAEINAYLRLFRETDIEDATGKLLRVLGRHIRGGGTGGGSSLMWSVTKEDDSSVNVAGGVIKSVNGAAATAPGINLATTYPPNANIDVAPGLVAGLADGDGIYLKAVISHHVNNLAPPNINLTLTGGITVVQMGYIVHCVDVGGGSFEAHPSATPPANTGDLDFTLLATVAINGDGVLSVSQIVAGMPITVPNQYYVN